MKIYEFFLDGTIKSFTVGIHFRSLWIGMIVNKVQIIEFPGEMLHEFRTIVSEHIHEWIGKYHQAILKEFFCGQ